METKLLKRVCVQTLKPGDVIFLRGIRIYVETVKVSDATGLVGVVSQSGKWKEWFKPMTFVCLA